MIIGKKKITMNKNNKNNSKMFDDWRNDCNKFFRGWRYTPKMDGESHYARSRKIVNITYH